MSWQDYVDTNLVGSGSISKAAICGLAGGGSVWAKSADYNITDAEVQTLVAAATGSPSDVFGTGIHLAGVKFLTIKADEDEIAGKKGATGVFIFKTGQALLIGEHGDAVMPGVANKVVGDLADYLKGVGY